MDGNGSHGPRRRITAGEVPGQAIRRRRGDVADHGPCRAGVGRHLHLPLDGVGDPDSVGLDLRERLKVARSFSWRRRRRRGEGVIGAGLI